MDRNLLEVRRAFSQIINGIEKRLTRLELRAWSGAVRSVTLDEFAGMNSTPQTVLNLPVTSGRWIIEHRGYLSVEATGVGASAYLVSSTPTQEIARTPLVIGWNVISATFPLCDFGEVILDDVTTINLAVNGDGFDTAVWKKLSLMARPV